MAGAPPIQGSPRTSAPDEPRFLLRGVGRQAYDALAEALERAGSHVRLTYDRGDLELMSPSPEHEWYRQRFHTLVELTAEVYGIPIDSLGSTTFRSEDLDRGLEPDECYYTANWRRVAGKKRLNLSVDPVPDPVVEVDITSSSLDRRNIYAALGVPEIWRFDGEALRFHVLQPDRSYVEVDRSPTFPDLPAPGIVSFFETHKDLDNTTRRRECVTRVRDQIDRRVNQVDADEPA